MCSSSDHAHDVELRMSKEQMSNSALNIMNNASITGGTFTFNIMQKTDATFTNNIKSHFQQKSRESISLWVLNDISPSDCNVSS
jgi:hypothetical protein